MSVRDQAVAAVLAQLTLTADGALLGIGVAYVAYRSIRKLMSTSSALRKISEAPSVYPSDLRSILLSEDGNSDQNCGNSSNSSVEGGKLVIVRGIVDVNPIAAKGEWMNMRGNGSVLVSPESGDKGVMLMRSQSYIYNEWRGVLRWTNDLRSILSTSWREQELYSLKRVPFVLAEPGKWSQLDNVVVNMEGSRHPLPLTTVYHHLQPICASPFTFLQALFGLEYPVGLLDEEKILPLGKEITAVGICHLRNGTPEIKSCKDLPYFLSDLTKDEIVADLSFKSNVLMWSGIIFGTLAIGILGFSIARYWIRWKERRRQQALQRNDSTSNETTDEPAADEEIGDIPDGQLCVICLTRRRCSAFVPCGHLVCCARCAFSVGREGSPKCPVCRQPIRSSVRIYDS